ncbi:MAG: CoA pyrophosphatase [Acidimicrobiales bacterium]|nr:CoA pyrophosphatase [Acidimicrobiales bacterium]
MLGEPNAQTRQSAVLVPLYEHDDDVFVILTRRPLHMRSHAGEVSFPGGGVEPGDPDLWATAVREACEEIGLDPARPEPLGELDRLFTRGSQSLVAPQVAHIGGRPAQLVPQQSEVDAILHVPISELLAPDVFREEVWSWEGRGQFPMNFFELVGDTVWGATAAMLRQLLSIGLGLDDDFARRLP